MNYQASLTRLQDYQKWLEDNKSNEVSVYHKPRFLGGKIIHYETEWDSDKDKDEWELVKNVAENYSCSSGRSNKRWFIIANCQGDFKLEVLN